MMEKLDSLLAYIKRTNPGMTKERLIDELSKCRYSTIGLIAVWQNSEKQAV